MARTTGAYARAASRLQHHGGDEAVLRGGTPTTAILEHDVALIGDDGQTVVYTLVAAIPTAHDPRVDDTLSIGPITYTVDAILTNDSYRTRVALRP